MDANGVTLAEEGGGNNSEGVGIGVGKAEKTRGDRKPGRMLRYRLLKGDR